jgi:hypothetical protein
MIDLLKTQVEKSIPESKDMLNWSDCRFEINYNEYRPKGTPLFELSIYVPMILNNKDIKYTKKSINHINKWNFSVDNTSDGLILDLILPTS